MSWTVLRLNRSERVRSTRCTALFLFKQILHASHFHHSFHFTQVIQLTPKAPGKSGKAAGVKSLAAVIANWHIGGSSHMVALPDWKKCGVW